MDTGDNLSTLGMSILLALLLSGWLGARVRIAQSHTYAAMVAVWYGDAFHLVDPSRTLCNLFHFLPVSGGALAREEPYVGMVIETVVKSMWRVAVVRVVTIDTGIMTVETVYNQSRMAVSVHSHAWRRATTAASDTEAVVRPLLNARISQKRIRGV